MRVDLIFSPAALREKLREISTEAEKRIGATFEENQRLKAERDELLESCTNLEKVQRFFPVFSVHPFTQSTTPVSVPDLDL